MFAESSELLYQAVKSYKNVKYHQRHHKENSLCWRGPSHYGIYVSLCLEAEEGQGGTGGEDVGPGRAVSHGQAMGAERADDTKGLLSRCWELLELSGGGRAKLEAYLPGGVSQTIP